MEFRILGPLEVVDGGCSLTLGRGRQRALLAALILRANQVVPSDVLLEEVWGDDPPASGARVVQVYVSQLRKVLGAEAIVTRAPGYVLVADADAVDLHRFERLVAEARQAEPAAAAAKLREALTLWRGAPLADFAYDSFAQTEIARIQELRLCALEARIEADLELGGHTELVGELEALVAENPLREQLRAHLMVALYRSGRQSEALSVYQDVGRLLREELGIEPGRQLRELERAILNQDESLDLERLPAAAERPPADVQPELVSEPVGREVRKTVTAVFVGLAVTSARGEPLDPEASRRVARRALAEIEAAVERYGGTLETVAGDAVTAVFGFPVVHEDDAVRAVRAAGEIREGLGALAGELEAERNALLEVRLGIGTGRVVTGGEGAQLRASGEPLSVAARLGRAAAPGEFVVDELTRRLVGEAAVVEAAEVASTRAFRVVEVADQLPGHLVRLASPMVGRKRERRRLHDAFEQALDESSCLLVTILGTAGVGKSRLVQEFLGEVAGRALIARGRCLPYGEGITYWPLVEVVREAAALGDAGTPEERVRKLAGLVEGEEGAELIARRVAGLIGLAETAGGAEQAFAAVCAFFEALARRRPLVLVFDDVHWAEATFLDIVEYVADWARDSPILLVCLARSELLDLRPGWGGGKLHAISTVLEPLSEAESVQLVGNLAGAAPLEEAARRRIVEAAEGNPLFVEEMLALALADGHESAELEVPPTIQALLAARLDRLADEERAVIEAGAVEGLVFHQSSVEELVLESVRPAAEAHVMSLIRKELVRPERPLFSDERAFRFRHLLIRDAAYESIPKKARAEMHARHAAWLERKTAERAGEYDEIIGYHLEQASRYRVELDPRDRAAGELARRAAKHLGAAGRRAFLRSDPPAAVNLISRAAALLPAADPARVNLIPNIRVMQGMPGDLSWANEILREAAEAGDQRLKAHALVQGGFLRLFTEPGVAADDLIEVGERAACVFEKLADELGLARAWRLIAQAHYLARRAGACAETSETALVHARRAEDPLEVAETVDWLAAALSLGPAPASEALRRCERLSEEAAGDQTLEVKLLSTRAYLEAIQGRAAEAQRLIERARGAVDDPGDLYRIALFSAYAGLVAGLVLRADPVAAERELRAGYRALEEVGEQTNYSVVAALLAQTLCDQERYAEAEELTRVSEQAARANDVYANVTWRSVRARVLARLGELAAAETLAREAVAFAEQSDFLIVHGDALTDLAEVLERTGRPREATSALEDAVRLYERKENLVSAAKVRSLLRAYA